MKKCIMLALVGTLFFTFSTRVALAQEGDPKKEITVKATDVNKSRGKNPNIKEDMPTTDEKTGKSRGDCNVYFNSYCGYFIKIYVDGKFRGTLSPYSSGTVIVGEGYTTIYCISAGGTKEWNAKGNCEGKYEYKLYCD